MSISRKLTPIDCKKGLHQLVPSVNQLGFMKQHSERLLEVLDVQLEQTYAVAPNRQQTYELSRLERCNPRVRERLLEKAIWMQWSAEAVTSPEDVLVPGLCRHVQAYQMPLQGKRTDKSWGRLDIVGVTENGLPIVLELKQEDAKDPPLRMLVEGLAYAVAVRRAWNEGSLSEQWGDVVTIQSPKFIRPNPLVTVPVIGIAPAQYWNRCIGDPEKRTAGKVPQLAWKPFRDLCDACNIRGFPVTFLKFDVDEPDANGLPQIRNVSKVRLPQ